MKRTIDLNEFRDLFQLYGRGNNFSLKGLEILFNELEALEHDTGEERELDVIGLCCDFSETTLDDWQHDYGNDETETMTDSKKIEHISDRTWLLAHFKNELGETVVIYQNY
jgi:hypothetical protein